MFPQVEYIATEQNSEDHPVIEGKVKKQTKWAENTNEGQIINQNPELWWK